MDLAPGTLRGRIVRTENQQTGALQDVDLLAAPTLAVTNGGSWNAGTAFAQVSWTDTTGNLYLTGVASIAIASGDTLIVYLPAAAMVNGTPITIYTSQTPTVVANGAPNVWNTGDYNYFSVTAPGTGVAPPFAGTPTITINRIDGGVTPAVVWTRLGVGENQFTYSVPTATGDCQVQERIDVTVNGIPDHHDFQYVIRPDAISSGIGNAAVTLTVTVAATGAPVANALATLTDAGGTVARGVTNASGQVVLVADDGTYTLTVTAAGFGGYSGPVTLPVPGGTINISG